LTLRSLIGLTDIWEELRASILILNRGDETLRTTYNIKGCHHAIVNNFRANIIADLEVMSMIGIASNTKRFLRNIRILKISRSSTIKSQHLQHSASRS
jgi:hypothetical protein